MMAGIEPPPKEDREEQAIKIPGWVKIAATVILVGVVVVIVYGYWTTPGWVGVSGKRFWDYLELLIVPVVIAGGVALINWMQSTRERLADEKQKEHERQMEDSQRNRELEAGNQRAQAEALQAYLDQIGQMLLDEVRPLSLSTEEDVVRKLAQARTLTVLSRLDGRRKGSVLRFLSEAGLIYKKDTVIALGGTRSKASGSNRRDEDGSDATITGTELGDYARTLAGARLEQADLQGANLYGTNLTYVNLTYADLTGADLRNADLRSSLLQGANLMSADLRGATLDDAILAWANLYRAKLTEEELQRLVQQSAVRNALVGVMMPDGTRPFPAPPEIIAEMRKRPKDQLAQREDELEEIAGLLEQQGRKREQIKPDRQKYEEWLKSREGDGER